jgi:hypothetical protein
MLYQLTRAGVEGMSNMSGSNRVDMYKDLIAAILSLIIALLIVAFVGKWLWNSAIVDLFTFARPVKSVWSIIGLMLFWALIK